MKKSIFKKLGGLFLGLAMGLGVAVGVTAGNNKASEVRAAEASVQLCTSWNKTLAYASAYTQDYTIDNLTGGTTTMTLGVQGVYRQSNSNTYFQMNKKSGYFKNTTKMPGKITKIETTWSAAKNPTKCYFAVNAAATSNDSTITVSAATSVTYTPNNAADYYYFNIDVSTGSGSAQMTSCVVYYETAGTTKTLSSLAISGQPANKTYDSGEEFNVAGLTVTATYDDNTTKEITDGITWTFNPTGALTVGQTSISVVATVGAISSPSYKIEGLTVKKAAVLDNDVISSAVTGVTSGSYTGWSGKSKTTNSTQIKSNAVYAGTTAQNTGKTTGNTQLNQGKGAIWTTASGGYIKSISVTYFDSNSQDLKIYGQQDAYTSLTASPSGTVIATLNATTTTAKITGEYENIYVYATGATYLDTITFGWAAPATLESISIGNEPNTKTYNAGENFSTQGLVVNANYSDGTTVNNISDYDYEPKTMTSTTTEVTISYGGKTAKITGIDVAYFDGIKITTAASKTSYHDGEKFDVSGLVVKAVTKHSSGIADDEVDVTNSVTYKIGTSAATPGTTEVKKGDNQTVTISYNGKTATYAIDCGYAYVTGIEFGVAPETMGPGDTYTPTATVSPLTAEQGKAFTVESQTEGVLVEFDGETLKISDGTAAGSVTLLVTSSGKKQNGEFATDEVTITVSAAAIPQLTGFDIDGTATKATQYLNDTFELDLSGLTITGKYDIENPNPETFGIEDFLWETDSYDYPYGIYVLNSDLDISLEGYIELVEDFCETIEFVNEDITNKTYYTTDESFDHTGLSISGKMASGADAVIDTSKVEYIFSTTPAELGVGTGKSVSVYAKYGDAETDSITISGIEVKEIALESISVTTQPSKLTYTIGESFSSNGIVVKGTNNDGSDAGEVTSECTFEYDETAFLKAGTPTITVKHSSGKTATFTVTVNAKTLNPGTTTWTLVTASQDDWSGTYILGNSSTDGTIKIVEAGSFSSGQFAIKDATLSNGNLSGADVKESNAIVITKNPNGDGYAVCANGHYVSRNANSNGIDVSDTPVYGNTISYGSSKVTIAGAGGRVLTYYAQNSNFKYYASSNNCAQLFKMTKTEGESRTLAGITATYNHTGDTYYAGDEVVSADFTVKAWYNNGDTVNNISGFTITDSTLVEGDNTIELSYEGKKCTVLVSGIETRTATVDHVYVEAETGYQVNYYLDGTTAAWNLEKINVVAYWTDGTTNTSSLSDLVESGDVTLTKSSPEVGDTSFTVSGSYYGTAIDSTHNSVTVSVVAKAITSLSWAQRFDGYSFNVFEGDTINKSAFAKQNSTSYIKANFNDGSSDKTYSIDNCSVALYRREGSSNIKVKDVTFDANGNYTFEAEDDGLYFLLTAGGKTTVYSDAAVFSVCERLNGIIVPGDDITKTIDTSNFSPALPTSTGSTGSSTAEGITFTYDGLYNYTKNSSSHIALPKTNGAYFASSKLPGDLKSIGITKGDQAINSAATLYISKDGNAWDTAKAFRNAEFTYSVTGEGYRYFKIVTDGSNYTNIGSLIVKYSGNTDVANTDSVTQKSVIEFAKYFYEELNEVCNSFDTTSDAFKEAWSNVANKYNAMFGSSSTIEGLDKTLAANMFKYAYPNGRVGEEADVLQLAMQRYDTIVARDTSLSNFITRASSYNAPRVNNPIVNLSNVDNSVWVISAVALVGLTAIGGYFFYRKRKEI